MTASKRKSEFTIKGMHCQSCVSKIQTALSAIPGVSEANVTLDPPRVAVTRDAEVPDARLRKAVQSAGSYDLVMPDDSEADTDHVGTMSTDGERPESLYPLLLIVGFITGVMILVAIRTAMFQWQVMMGNFMAGFFIVFGFFKLLDLPGFVGTYRTYDLLAKALSPWAWIYPFVEVGLGVLYLLRFAPLITNLVTLLLMLFGAVGVARALLNKQRIRCACLGSVLNLPMTTVTLIEDLGMALMAGGMLIHQW